MLHDSFKKELISSVRAVFMSICCVRSPPCPSPLFSLSLLCPPSLSHHILSSPLCRLCCSLSLPLYSSFLLFPSLSNFCLIPHLPFPLLSFALLARPLLPSSCVSTVALFPSSFPFLLPSPSISSCPPLSSPSRHTHMSSDVERNKGSVSRLELGRAVSPFSSV